MSRRRRAALFALGALACAVAAAVAASGYGRSAARRFGELRPVLVAARDLPARRPIDVVSAHTFLDVRRVPARFVPAGALQSPAQAVGEAPVAPVPAGAYLLASQLRSSKRDHDGDGARMPPGRRPVEIAVTAAEPLLADEHAPRGEPVDVVVTTEPGAGGRGRTYVAASAVPLLALRAGGATANPDQDPATVSTATLALTRAQALELIDAESFARAVRLLSR